MLHAFSFRLHEMLYKNSRTHYKLNTIPPQLNHIYTNTILDLPQFITKYNIYGFAPAESLNS